MHKPIAGTRVMEQFAYAKVDNDKYLTLYKTYIIFIRASLDCFYHSLDQHFAAIRRSLEESFCLHADGNVQKNDKNSALCLD